jgi:hypothetical protein
MPSHGPVGWPNVDVGNSQPMQVQHVLQDNARAVWVHGHACNAANAFTDRRYKIGVDKRVRRLPRREDAVAIVRGRVAINADHGLNLVLEKKSSLGRVKQGPVSLEGDEWLHSGTSYLVFYVASEVLHQGPIEKRFPSCERELSRAGALSQTHEQVHR